MAATAAMAAAPAATAQTSSSDESSTSGRAAAAAADKDAARLQAHRRGPAMRSLDAWLDANGERAINAFVTVFMWGAAGHAAYLAVLPAPLRAAVAERNAGLWKRLSAGTLLAVAAYDAVCGSRLAAQQAEAHAEGRVLRRQLQRLEEQAEQLEAQLHARLAGLAGGAAGERGGGS